MDRIVILINRDRNWNEKEKRNEGRGIWRGMEGKWRRFIKDKEIYSGE